METWAITPYKDALLLHALHEHLDFPEQQQQIPLIFQRFMHSIIAVEKVGYQLAMIQYLISLGLPIKPFQPQADKITRSTTGSILYSNGKAYHNRDMQGIEEAEKELFSFPKAPHDEYPDCHAMMALVISTYGRPGLLDGHRLRLPMPSWRGNQGTHRVALWETRTVLSRLPRCPAYPCCDRLCRCYRGWSRSWNG